ncbi:MAG TPA: LamG domain-containing protein [Sedimentisphaerales bacterium]|nr:LamG domain-containing protein [Sedimentisphaerales bacterium]
MWKKLIVSIFCVVVLVPYAALAQEVMVSFDGSSADIAGQPTTNTPGPWDADDSVWSTTDEVVPAIGSQAAFKAAIAQAGTAQRRIGQAHTNGHAFVGGGSTNAEGAAGHAPSPWANIIGFDTTSFDDSLALSEISVTLRNRMGTDTLDVRWFVDAGGETYVSGVVAAGVGTTDTEVTLADTTTIEWFAFDKNANIEISTALGSSVGSPIFTDVDYVGIHQQLTYTTLQNWHGAYVPHFSATAISYASTEARKPDPADGATEVLWNTVLGWTPGEFAATHDVYLGTIFADVNEASRTDPRGVLARQGQTATTYDPPGGLDFGQTYYWRVDEVNAPPDSTVYPGEVWSFTTELLAYPIENVTATASSSNVDEEAENTVNGSGVDANDLHSTETTDMWRSSPGGDGLPWIEYEFDRISKLHEMWVWNHNSSLEQIYGFGFKDVSVEYSADGIDYKALGTTHEFAQAPGMPGYAHETTIDFEGAAAKYVRLTANSTWGSPLGGLSEVRFFRIPVHAKEPYPDSGATDVDPNVVLGWRAGREAVSHDVYISDDPNALALAGPVTEPVFDTASLDLKLGQDYHWRVDEVNDAETTTTWQSDIWSFTTVEYLVVDDFESYDVGNNEIWWAWKDGLGYVAHDNEPAYPGNGTGSAVGNETSNSYTEETIVHGGKQSMPLFYDNSSFSNSEATVNTDDLAIGRDWTAHGIQTLSLWFYGDAANVPGQLYVKVNGFRIDYDGDAGNLRLAGWQPWNIDLTSIGANLSSVTSLAIGIQGPGASGTLLLDDIRLYPYPRQLITPVEPDAANLAAYYPLDGDYQDASGNNRHGTPVGGPLFVPGAAGQALELDGADDYVNIDGYKGINADQTDPNNPVQLAFSISNWVKTTSDSGDTEMVTWGASTGSATRLTWRVHEGRLRTEHNAGNLRGNTYVNDGEWHHVALVVTEGANLRPENTKFYVDGVEDTYFSGDDDTYKLVAEHDVRIGMSGPEDSRYFPGALDEIRIYDRALTDGEIAGLAGRINPFDKPF